MGDNTKPYYFVFFILIAWSDNLVLFYALYVKPVNFKEILFARTCIFLNSRKEKPNL